MMIAMLAGIVWLDYWLESDAAMDIGALADRKGIPLMAVAIVLALFGMRELSRMAGASGPKVLPISGLFGIVAVAAAPVACQDWPSTNLLPMMLGVVVLAVFLEQMIRFRTDDALRRVSVTFLAVMYLGVGASLILTVRIAWGVPMLVIFLAGVKGTDSGAYFTGKAFGRHKLIPWLSPGKTWEGLIGGMIIGAALSVLAAYLWKMNPRELSSPWASLALWKVGVFGAVVGLAGQFGDLCESLLKRSASVKDSGAVLPEFGGVLDVLDSPLLAAPVALIMLMILGA